MKAILINNILCSVTSLIIINQNLFSQDEFIDPYDIISKTVVNLRFQSGNKEASGTGFIINNGNSFYLCTAAHIAINLNSSSIITFPTSKSEPFQMILKELQLNIYDTTWLIHPKNDLALLPINLMTKHTQKIDPTSVGINKITDYLPRKQAELTMIGFPFNLGSDLSFKPITKRSYRASDYVILTNKELNITSDYYLLEDPSIGGFSGSPVFILPQMYYYSEKDTIIRINNYLFAGLVSAVLSDSTGGKLAAIVPPGVIKDLVNNAPKFSGIQKYFHENGKIWTERLYENGKISEVLFNHDKNGNPVEKGTLINGSGTLIIYNEELEIIEIEEYINGELTNKTRE